jgi:hypothetical protein
VPSDDFHYPRRAIRNVVLHRAAATVGSAAGPGAPEGSTCRECGFERIEHKGTWAHETFVVVGIRPLHVCRSAGMGEKVVDARQALFHALEPQYVCAGFKRRRKRYAP